MTTDPQSPPLQPEVYSCDEFGDSPCQGTGNFSYEHNAIRITNGSIACPHATLDAFYVNYLFDSKLEDYWRRNAFDVHSKTHRCMLEVWLDVCMQTNRPIDCTHSALQKFFEGEINGAHIPYDPKFNFKFDYWKMCVAANKIGYLIGDSKGTFDIQTYQGVVKILSEVSPKESDMLLKVLEQRVGKISHMASRVIASNVRWVMAKLKLTNSIALIHEMFSNPTILGKCTAIWRLLELHELIWKDIPWETAQQIVDYAYMCVQWIIEKTHMGVELAKEGYEWVKATVYKEDSDETSYMLQAFHDREAQPQASSISSDSSEDVNVRIETQTFKNSNTEETTITIDLPQIEPFKPRPCPVCETKPQFGCSLCQVHWCADCHQQNKKVCSCELPQIHLFGENCCDLSKQGNNDCWYRALARHLGQSVVDIKKYLEDYLSNDVKMERFKEYIEVNRLVQNVNEIIQNVRKQFDSSVMCEVDTILLCAYVYDFPIYVLRNNAVLANAICKPEYEYTNPCIIQHFDYPHFEYMPITTDIASKVWLTYTGAPMARYTFVSTLASSLGSSTTSISTSSSADVILEACGIDISKASKIKSPPPPGTKEPTKVESQELVDKLEQNSIGKQILDWIKGAFTDSVTFFEENPLVGGVIALVTGIATFLGISIPVLSTGLEKNSLCKKLGDATRTLYYTQRGTSALVDSFKTCVDACKDILGISTDSQINDFKVNVAKMYALANDMIAEATTNPGNFINNGQRFLEFRAQMTNITNTYIELSKLKGKNELAIISPIWYALTRAFQDLTMTYNKFMAGISTRQEPVAIWLWGPSDFGKSQLCDYLIDEVNRVSNRPDLKTMTISKGPEFWNTYCQQAHIKIDDFSSYVDSQGDLDSLAFFNLVTCAAYNPNMAHLNDKNTMANPLFVWVCSNFPTIPPNSNIQNQEAFERRRHVFVHVDWPDHARCPKGRYDCVHWQGKNLNNFDHLTLTICDPNVTDINKRCVTSKQKGKYIQREVVDYKVKPEAQVIEAGAKLSVSQLVECILAKEVEQNEKFQQVLSRKKAGGALDYKEGQVAVWSGKPNIFITGKPGTGKSFILDSYHNASKLRKLFIKTNSDLDKFYRDRFIGQNVDVVIFDDLSTHIDNKNFYKLLQKIKERYDIKEPGTPLWIMGVNLEVLRTKVITEKGEEYFDLIWRRGEHITTKFKTYFKPMAFGWVSYTKDDVPVDNVSDIEKYVEYFIREEKVSQDTVVTYLKTFKPVISDIIKKTELSYRDKVDPTITVKCPISSKEFTKMINDCKMPTIAAFLTQGQCGLWSKKMSVVEIGRALFSTLKDCRDYAGVNFIDMDDFILQCWNNKFLGRFKGECVLFSFTDKSYYLDALSDVDCGYIESNRNIEEVIKSMSVAKQVIELADLTQVACTTLPPWFLLAGDIIATIAGIAGTALFAAGAVYTQHRANKALAFQEKVSGVLDACVKMQMESVPKMLEQKFLHPGPADIKADQYATIDEHDVLEDYREAEAFKKKKDYPKPSDVHLRAYEGSVAMPPVQEFNKDDYPKDGAPLTRKGKANKVRHQALPFKDLPVNAEYDDRPFDPVIHKTKPVLDLACSSYADMQSSTIARACSEVATDPKLPQIVELVSKNLASIISVSGKHLCYGVFVFDNICTTVHHVLQMCKVENLMIKCADKSVWKCKLYKEDARIDRLDLQIIDKTFPPKVDIRKHFPTTNMIPPPNTEAVLIQLNHDMLSNPVLFMRSYKIEVMKYVTYAGSTSRTAYYQLTYAGHRVGYKMTGVQTNPGDCGSLLIVADPAWTKGSVVAMHTAANTTQAHGRLIYSDHYSEPVQVEKEASVSEFLQCAKKYIYPVDDEDNVVGIVKNFQYIPNESRMYRNAIPVGEKKFEPAILSHNDTRNPGHNMLTKEAAKWCIPRSVLPKKIRMILKDSMEELAEWYADVLSREGITLTTLTTTQAINKLSGCPVSEPISTATSAGFPWADYTTKTGKTEYISTGPNGIRKLHKSMLVQKLLTSVNAYEEEAKGKGTAMTVFKIYLKDEPVKLKKIYDEPKTRTIAAAPLDFQIIYRKYIHAAQAWLASNWDKTPMKVGINPLSTDWNILFESLASTSLFGVDADAKDWDFSVHPEIIKLLSNFWNIMYRRLDPDWTDHHDKVRNVLYSKLHCFYMLVGRKIYRATGGVVSGHPGTAPDNSIINDFIEYINYKCAMMKVNKYLVNMVSYREDIASAYYGDDKVVALSEYIKNFYNGLEMEKGYAIFGIKVTSANKMDEIVAYKPLMECQFLGRSFKLFNNIVIGPLDRDRLCKTTWWVHGNKPHKVWDEMDVVCSRTDTIISSYESFLYESALQGKEFFDFARNVCMKIWKDFGGNRPLTYTDCISRIFAFVKDDELEVPGVTFYDCEDVANISMKHEPGIVHKFRGRKSWHFGNSYNYGNTSHFAQELPTSLKNILEIINNKFCKNWNSVLFNEYEPGGGIPWHKDNEPNLDATEGVGSLTIRGDGMMQWKKGDEIHSRLMSKGDFYIMDEFNAKYFQHRRVNHNVNTLTLTFRRLL